MKRSIFGLLNKESSVWWDDIDTDNNVETRKANFIDAFDRTIRELESQLGPDVAEWKWGRVHTVEYIHPVGRREPFDKIFNVGPMPINGGNEVLNNTGFSLNGSGEYKVIFGPAMRIILDFNEIDSAVSILPTGQSGNVLSDHYDDQAQMYANGEFRKMRMDREDIVWNQIGTLLIKPKK
ncbi:MAG: penicillin acylase family protein [Flavobacteriales bacterium]|nr:penicillin acylase family protein [Flavobacteriales bacterium]